MKKLASLLFAFVMVLGSCMDTVFAVGSGGFENQVPSARAMGRANSVAASVDDASAVSFNPARLINIRSSEVSVGITAQNLTTKYDDGAGTTQNSDNDMSYTPNFHFASKFGQERWSFGLGVNVPQGVATNWKENTPMALVATKSDLAVIDISPAAAFKINDQISVGAGLDYYSTDVTSKSQPDLDSDNISDANQELSGDGTDFGGNIGISYMLSERHMFGLTYKTGANIDVDGDLKIDDLNGTSAAIFGTPNYKTSVKSEVVVPPEVTFGYAQKVNEKFTAEFDAQWTKWSEFKEQKVKLTDQTSALGSEIVIPKDWEDVWSVGIGGEYMLKENAALRAGYAFFDSPIPTSSFEASTPDGDLHLLTLGGGYGFGDVTLDLAGQFYFVNDRHINNSATLPGTYKTHAEYYALNVSYKFGAK
jgi:long-chain fatty acid transport protein